MRPSAVEHELWLPLALTDERPDPYPGPEETPTIDAPPMPTLTVTSEPGPTPIALGDYPLCAEHDVTQWHSLIDPIRECHYDHQHGDDPHQLDWLFGAVGEEWGGQSISYPWHTMGETDEATKHRLSKWIVLTDLECLDERGSLSFRSLRLQIHADGNIGAATRYHSFYLQAELCDSSDPSYSGQVFIGGVVDYGNLTLASTCNRLTRYRVPIVGDLGEMDLRTENLQRIHHTPATWNCRSEFQNMPDHRFYRWYGEHSVEGLGVPVIAFGAGDWGPVEFPEGLTEPLDPADYTPLIFEDSWKGALGPVLHELRVRIPGRGVVNQHGYVDGGGRSQSGAECPQVSHECIPVHIFNGRPGMYRLDGVERGLQPTDHSLGHPEWIGYPN